VQGETNRVIGEHQLNRESSRSHSVFVAHSTCVHEGGDGTATVSGLGLVLWPASDG
jgi:kinesin family protein 6/9